MTTTSESASTTTATTTSTAPLQRAEHPPADSRPLCLHDHHVVRSFLLVAVLEQPRVGAEQRSHPANKQKHAQKKQKQKHSESCQCKANQLILFTTTCRVDNRRIYARAVALAESVRWSLQRGLIDLKLYQIQATTPEPDMMWGPKDKR